MFGNTPTSGLSIGKVISGISKSLNVANQLIPIYREVKPVIGNAKTILSTLKEFRNPNIKNTQKTILNKNKNIKKDISLKENTSNISTNNNPVFFN